MREIKFRAWFEPKKKMYDVGEISFIDDIVMLTKGNESVRCRISNYADFHMVDLMQFTGLHDKNGKEIFEGDILKTIYNDCGDEKKYTFIVGWSEYYGAFVVNDRRGIMIFNLLSDVILYQSEVLGNIYENPELLEVGE